MKNALKFALLLLFFSGCRNTFTDSEIKGVLTVDKSQFGNDKLEMYDPTSKISRFLYPGRKIIEIKQGLQSMMIRVMESGRAQLVKMDIPLKFVQMKENDFFIDGRNIDQNWDIKSERKEELRQVEYVKTSDSRDCIINGQHGLSGRSWELRDVRYNYVIHFVNPATGKDVGTFTAQGEIRTEYRQLRIRDCRPLKISYAPIVGDI